MVYDLAIGVLPTGSRARILAFGSDASSVRGTVRVQDTLGSTPLVRIAYVVGQAGTRPGVILFFANGVCATRRWETRGWLFCYYGCFCKLYQEIVTITNVCNRGNTSIRVENTAPFFETLVSSQSFESNDDVNLIAMKTVQNLRSTMHW